jgi:hypothetical protein
MAVAITAAALVGGPCPSAGVTVTGLGTGSPSTVSVWRNSTDGREAVPGYRRVTMTDASYLTDFYVPLGTPVSYEVEVITGPAGALRVTAAPVTVTSTTGWLMDALVPQTAIPVTGQRVADGFELMASSLKDLEYAADVSVFTIMGSDKPLALFGQRLAARGVDMKLATRSAEQNKKLADLLKSTAQLHFRPAPGWTNLQLGGAQFLANPSARQLPVTPHWGGKLTWWDLKSDVVAAPAIKVLTATFSYGDVNLIYSTYQQKLDAMSGKTYLDDLKNPLGG